jgi:hypothetical protein
MTIECVDVKLEAEEARKLFKSRMRRFKLGQFLFDTSFFIPYYLFRVEVLNGNQLTAQLLAIDATTGELDLYSFEQVPTELIAIESDQVGAITLSEKQALALLKEKVRRGVFLQGFFQIRDLTISGQLLRLLYLPYWVGFFKQKNQVDVEVIDALRGGFEGAKVRDLVYDWFAQEAATRRARQSGTS